MMAVIFVLLNDNRNETFDHLNLTKMTTPFEIPPFSFLLIIFVNHPLTLTSIRRQKSILGTQQSLNSIVKGRKWKMLLHNLTFLNVHYGLKYAVKQKKVPKSSILTETALFTNHTMAKGVLPTELKSIMAHHTS